jgi:hypothetical protein
MVSIPLLSGIIANEQAEFVQSLPVNLEPIIIDSGISKGMLRSATGCVSIATGPGIDRGGIAWNGTLHRVMGTKLVSIDHNGSITVLADLPGSGAVTMTYGFDRLAIRSGTTLYYWDGASLDTVTNSNLGSCLSVVWMSGYFVSTDGTSIVVTDLANPLNVNPLKYGSAEQDPDPIVALFRVRNELYALGGNTVEVYTLDANAGAGFPFQVNEGATIPVGCLNPQAVCDFQQSFAFVGGGRNQANGVWLAQGGTGQKLSTRLIDDAIAGLADTTRVALESRISRDEERLILHLEDRSFAYFVTASAKAGEPVWIELRSGTGMNEPYRMRNAIYCYGKWFVGDYASAQIGLLEDGVVGHFGEPAGERADTMMLYNEGNGAIIHELELIGANGRVGQDPQVFLSFTTDGETYTMERACSSGPKARRSRRVSWRPHKRVQRYIGLRLRSDGSGLQSWAALEASIEPLAS